MYEKQTLKVILLKQICFHKILYCTVTCFIVVFELFFALYMFTGLKLLYFNDSQNEMMFNYSIAISFTLYCFQCCYLRVFLSFSA